MFRPACLALVIGVVPFLLLVACPPKAFGEVPEAAPGYGVGARPLADVDRRDLAPPDVEALLAEDLWNAVSPPAIGDRLPILSPPGPRRFATPLAVSLSPADAGSWEEPVPGTRLWRLRIDSEGALALSFFFDRFDLPEGAQLRVMDPFGLQRLGPFTGDAKGGRLWTPVLQGDRAVVELWLPAGVATDFELRLAEVYYGYRPLGRSAGTQGTCHIDAICDEVGPYRDQAQAVAVYTLDGVFQCTGTLLNNTARDRRPLFLTADHCQVDADNAASVVVYWNFQSPVCGALSGGSLEDHQLGATWLADDRLSDVTLLLLDGVPDPSFGVAWAGWDVRGTAPAASFSVHHPSSEEKAVSFDDDDAEGLDLFGSGVESHWRVVDWDRGSTEGGSSGACLFDRPGKRCVGVLSGGFASCVTPEGEDWYGKLSVAWDGGDTPQSPLREYLDPVSTGETHLDALVEPFQCREDEATHCLQGGRFRVRVGWRDFEGSQGPASTAVSADDSGLFWFFESDNWEMLVKVLDGCGLNQRFWVFAAATTNVGYVLEVTDSLTGTVATWENPVGVAAPALTDTDAFATCP
ncbi:MAG: hypothetical protein AAGN66_03735 [Acidobacteriota bacterium]